MTTITRVEKLPADFDRAADRYTFNLYGPHHIVHKGEKLIATVKMNVGDLSLNECNELPHLFAEAPSMRDTIVEQAARIVRLEKDRAALQKRQQQDIELLDESFRIIAGLAHKYRMNDPERVAARYPDQRTKALELAADMIEKREYLE
jgi:hypothetical protein